MASKASGGPSKPAEAEDPATAKLVARARKIADQLADESKEQMKAQAHYEAQQQKMAEGAAKTRRLAEQAEQ